MMALNHSLLAAAGTALLLQTSDWKVLCASALVAQLPDADLTTSHVGKLLYPISRVIEYNFPHRGLTHSFFASIVVALVALPLILYWQISLYYQAVVVGYTLGWLGDTISKSGVACFWPHQARLVIPRNPDLRLETSSPAEFWISACLTGILAVALSINGAGGILDSITQSMGQEEGAYELYLKQRDTNLVYAQVQGFNLITGKQIRGRFEVIDTDKQELILHCPEGLLKTGEQLKTDSIKLEKGSPISVRISRLELEEENLSEALQRLGRIPSRTYLSGELKFTDAEDLRIHKRPDIYDTIRAVDGSDVKVVQIKDASALSLAKRLGEFEASGSLFIRSIYVRK